jgi:hypothetical protein
MRKKWLFRPTTVSPAIKAEEATLALFRGCTSVNVEYK